MIRSLSKRSYSVLAPAYSAVTYTRKGEQLPSAPAPVKQVTKTMSGIAVATVDQQGPLSSVALVINAGSRHESPDALGVAHLWKNAFIRTLPDSSIVKTIRRNELRGDTLYTAVTREHLVIASDFLRDDLVDVVPELVANFVNRQMEVYEFLDARSQVAEETEGALADPATLLVENLHRAAFRSGLGNPLLAKEGDLAVLKRSDLQAFADRWFTPDRIAVVGRDVHHKDLLALVERAFQSFTAQGATKTPAAKYFGGERRVDLGSGADAEYAIAFPSPAVSANAHPAALVLTALLDGSRHVKWGSPAAGLLAKAAVEGVTSVRAFQSCYSDAGLLGIHVSATSAAAVKASIQASLDALKSVAAGVTETDLTRAKKTALVNLETGVSREQGLVDLATRLWATQAVVDGKQVGESIVKVTAADVSKLAKGLLAAKPAVSAVGPSTLPYVDEFKI